MTEQRNIFKEFVDYVFDQDHERQRDKFLGGRVLNGFAFGVEANLRFQYCAGGYFAEGWIGSLKFRIYGNVAGDNGWTGYFCHSSGVIDETKPTWQHPEIPVVAADVIKPGTTVVIEAQSPGYLMKRTEELLDIFSRVLEIHLSQQE